MPRTKKQNELIRAETRSKLVGSAMTLYAQHGYAHTSIRKIADHAGVSVGLLYHYFSGKEAMLHAVFDNCMQIISAGFATAMVADTPQAKVAGIVCYIFDALAADRPFWGMFYSLRSQPAVTAVLGDEIRIWIKRLRDLFISFFTESGRETAVIDAYILYSLIEGTIQQYLLEPDSYPLDQVIAQLLAQFEL